MALFLHQALPRPIRRLALLFSAAAWRDGRVRRGLGAGGTTGDARPPWDTVEARRGSEPRYRSLVDLSPNAIFVHVRGAIVFANPAMVRLLGAASVDQVVGLDAWELVHPDDQADAAGRPGTGEFEEVRYRRLDGTEVRVETAATILRWDGRHAVMVVAHDITRSKRGEEAPRASEERLRGIMSNVADGVVAIDEDSIVESFNPAAERMFGYRDGEVIGRGVSVLMPEPERSGHDGFIRTYLRTGKSEIIGVAPREVTARRKDGTTFPMEIAVGEMQVGDKRRFIGAMRDITERRAAHDALRDNEARLRQVMDLVPHMIFARDLSGRFLLVNRATAEAYGTVVEEPTGAPHPAHHPDREELARFLSSDREIIASGQSIFIPEQTFHDVHGRIRYVQTFKVPFETGKANEPAVLGVSMDITERKAAEEQLRQAQKMEALGQLTGGVAHDFNILLTVVLGNLQLLQRQMAGNAGCARLTEAAIRASRRGSDLTKRLLSFARRQPLELEVVDLNALVDDTSELLSRTLGQCVAVELNLGRGLWKTRTDPALLQNALLNLAINADHAMPDGGTLTIETANVSREAGAGVIGEEFAPGDYVKLTVADTGAGMPPDVVQRVFDPFFTTKGRNEGSGLGLSMVYGFAKQSGGHVAVDSVPGKGTKATLYLPRADGDASSMTKTAAPDRMVAPDETILIVEDDAGIREIACKLLDSWGYRVVEAADGPAALDLLPKAPDIDVLFTDLMLPRGLGGYQLAVEVRRLRPDVKVLFASGNAQFDPDGDCGLDDGFSFLRKPYMADELASTLRALIENRETRQ